MGIYLTWWDVFPYVRKLAYVWFIQYYVFNVQNGTPPSEAPDSENNQPHIDAIERDEYYQYIIATEQSLMLDCTKIATALWNTLKFLSRGTESL